jgi:hypothetical protein
MINFSGAALSHKESDELLDAAGERLKCDSPAPCLRPDSHRDGRDHGGAPPPGWMRPSSGPPGDTPLTVCGGIYLVLTTGPSVSAATSSPGLSPDLDAFTAVGTAI